MYTRAYWIRLGMEDYTVSRRRDHVLAMFRAALTAVDPGRCVLNALSRQGRQLVIDKRRYTLAPAGRVFVVGMGKACAAMAAAVEAICGDLLAGGVVVTADGCATVRPRSIEVLEAAHPVPDARCEAAARRIMHVADEAREEDILFVLISGGGSSLFTLPAPGLSLADLVETNSLLLMSGATISEMNVVRKHLSSVTGGRLACRAFPARVIALVLSDVVGNPLDVIASGPAVSDPSTYGDARDVLVHRGLWDRLPVRVRQHIASGVRGDSPETPKPGDPVFSRVHTTIVGSGAHAALAAAEEARNLGYETLLLTTTATGEAREVGGLLAGIAREIVLWDRPVPPPAALIMAGETTVKVRGSGCGGRNQELALSAALEIDGLDGVVVGALGTDGIDGPTDAAGATVDGETNKRIRACGGDARRSLADNDAYAVLAAAGDLVITGPTGTNVADLYMALATRRDRRPKPEERGASGQRRSTSDGG